MTLSKELIQEALVTIDEKTRSAVVRLWEISHGLQYPACIGHSGGKDSVVNHWIVNSAIKVPSLDVIHTAKPGGDNAIHPDTLEFLYQRPFPITYWPRALGNSKKYKTQFDGSRRSEHDRLDRSADFIRDGKQTNRATMELVEKNSMFGMDFVFPIYDWSDADVWACIYKNNLPYSPEYVYEAELLRSISSAL
jgi:3'-phosphoadenosine 5'-phosphosulfate sulfotransferase (PAPS reductase)/FAD synthetase